MLKALMNFFSVCWKPFGVDIVGGSSGGDNDGSVKDGKDGLLWFRDLGRCATGEYSMAVVQANQVLEDQSQIECGPFGTFVGVYDGHGGPEAARFVCDHLFRHLQAKSAETNGVVTAETIKRAFRATEEGFLDLVSQLWSTRPQIATVGSCCLVGMISQHTLFVANLGDSRAVLGRTNANTGGVDAVQLTSEHNANVESVRRELRDLHPDDPQIVMLKHGVWRVKGIIQCLKLLCNCHIFPQAMLKSSLLAGVPYPQTKLYWCPALSDFDLIYDTFTIRIIIAQRPSFFCRSL